jgi:simple sugar transport system ATP-binding protein
MERIHMEYQQNLQNKYRLVLEDISKSYPLIKANDAISLKVKPGEIHAILGENGAGKSTLMKILYGVIKPDSGSIYWEDQQVTIHSPAFARNLGIGMIFQHFALFESLTVLENIWLSMDKSFILETTRDQYS